MNDENIKSDSRRKKPIRKALTVLIAVVAGIALILVGFVLIMRLPISDYYAASERTFKIPDINDGFIAQGLSYDSSSGDFYVTGYMNDQSASPIYIVDKDTGRLEKKVLMADSEGNDFKGHCGGIAYFKGKVYVAGSSDACLYVFDPADIRNADSGEKVIYKDVIDLTFEDDGIGVSFVATDGDLLYAGEFYREGNYETNPLHYVETADGTQKALMVGLDIDQNTAVPQIAYSIPNQIQGAAFCEKRLFLSESYGLAFSHIYEYDLSKVVASGTHTVLGVEVPLMILDSTVCEKTYKIAPMSEEIDFANGRMYTMCESASDKYIFGKLTGAERVYATDIDKLK